MADEVTFSLLSSNGGRVSSVLSALVAEQLWDPTDLRQTLDFYAWNAYGSDTMDVSQNAVPGSFTAATSEIVGTNVANSAYTTSRFQLQVARYLRKYQLSDLFGVSGGPIDLSTVVKALQDGVALTMTDLLTALFTSVANSVGSTGVDLTVDNIYSAAFQLNSSNAMSTADAPYTAVLHPTQMNDFRSSLRAETGAMQWAPATSEMLATKGPGYQGSWNGIQFYQAERVQSANAGADRNGCMYAKGAFAYTLAPVGSMQGHIPQQNIILDAGALVVESSRDADNGLTSAVANLYPGIVEAEDLRACAIITDA